jgi:hypothetical protein
MKRRIEEQSTWDGTSVLNRGTTMPLRKRVG